MYSKIFSFSLLIIIFILGSCKEEDPTPEVSLSIQNVGYSYVDFNVKVTDLPDNYGNNEITFYYSTVNNLDDFSFQQVHNYEWENFTATLLGLDMGQDYYVKAVAQGVSSRVRHVVTNQTTINCNVNVLYLIGDNSVSTQWISGPSASYNYLYKNSNSGISGVLEGDFTQVSFHKEVPATYYNGVYTIYSKLNENGVTPSKGTSSISVVDGNGVFYEAVGGQVFEYLGESQNTNFIITFCDVLFANQAGDTVTLSGRLFGK